MGVLQRLRSLFRFRRSAGPAETAPVPEHPVWAALCQAMDQEELWKEPGLSMSALCRHLSSNKTTVNLLYRQHGSSFSEDLARRRIAYVMAELERDAGRHLEDVFFDAGYQTYSTGWRQFRRTTGVSPTEYIQRLSRK